MTRHDRWRTLWLAACSIFAFGCYEASKPEEFGGHTNWLTCEQFADCAASAQAVECSRGYCVDGHGARIAASPDAGRISSRDAGDPGDAAHADTPALDQVALDATFDGETYMQVWGSSDADVWVLGRAEPPPVDGDAGPQVSIGICNPNPAPQTYYLRHFDGLEWSRTEVQAAYLAALRGSDSENTWMVGSRIVLRRQGTQWIEQDIADATKLDPSDDPCGEVSLLSVFARASDDVWAVGYINPSPLGHGLIIHFDGTQWTRMPVDAPDGFFAVWAAAADDAWAMGASGIAYHYDGKQWSSVDVGTQLYLFSIWGTARDDVWAAGYADALLHYDGTRWQSVSSSVKSEVRSLTGRASDDIWTVTYGDPNAGQKLLHWDGARWQVTPVSSSEVIEDIWLSPTGKLWSAGTRLARRY